MALLDYCRLVMLLASYCAFAHALCEDVTDCSARCNPGTHAPVCSPSRHACMQSLYYEMCNLSEHWRRQLCVFYTELMEWRATAVRCGLDVPEFGDCTHSLSLSHSLFLLFPPYFLPNPSLTYVHDTSRPLSFSSSMGQ